MRFLAVVTGWILGAGLLLLGGASAARADGGGSPAALPGTDAEARDYALREATSPGVQEFIGGDGGFVLAILVIGLLVILFLYLDKQGKI